MKILYDHQVFVAQRWGGVSRYFVELAQRIGRTEAVSIHAPVFISQSLASAPKELVRGIRTPEFPGVRMLANAVAKATRPRQPFDVFHPTWYRSPDWRPAGARVAHTVHDMIAELFPEDHSSYPGQAAEKKRAVCKADIVFCVSQSTKYDLVRILGIDPERVVVTYHGSSLQLAPPAKLAVDWPFILYVGQRTGYKNFASLLQAFKSSSSLRSDFGLVCFGGGAFSPDELEAIEGLKGSGTGSVINLQGGDELLAGAYRAAAVFVCPSRYEGFGMPVLEAMACACPVITSRVSSLPEVGGDAAIYAEDSSAEGLREALEALLSDRHALVQAREKGLERAALFSWESTARATLEGYRSILG